MSDCPPMLLAALTGLISGVLLCIPVGPVNLTVMNEGARHGFKAAILIGVGSTVMEVTYCSIAFTGFSSLFQNRFVQASMELCSFVFMLYLGFKFLLAKSIPPTTRLEASIEQKLHPHSAFMIGFVRTMGNPGVLVFWVILAGTFIAKQWVAPSLPCKLACIAGVAVGTGGWFLVLSWAVSWGHKRFSERTLLRMEHCSGVFLLGIALVHGAQIIWQLSKHHL